jgi:hypothetical protein
MSRLGQNLVVLGVLLVTMLPPARGQSPSDPEAELTTDFRLPPVEEFDVIIERPLFAKDRRPVAGADTSPAEPPAEDTGMAVQQVVLAGTATDQRNRAVAILQDVAQGSAFRVWVGDEIAGWTVKSIQPREIVLVHDGQEISVTLDEPAVPPLPDDRSAPAR